MKKRLTKAEFVTATEGLDVGQQTLDIAHGVLVEGIPQSAFVEKFHLTRGAVSQAVGRVWTSHQSRNLPPGYQRITAVLPEPKAFIVKKWAAETAKKLEGKK